MSRLLKNPGAWRNSWIRENIPPLLKHKLDTLEKNQLKDALRVMKTLSVQYNFETGILAMTEAVKICESAKSAEEKFLHHVLQSELDNREFSRKARLLKEACFPVYKKLDTYDFSHLKLPSSLTKEDLLNGNLVHYRRNIVMYGVVGTGKTHLAAAMIDRIAHHEHLILFERESYRMKHSLMKEK